eukprot:1551047-Amphidinium_carterae.1
MHESVRSAVSSSVVQSELRHKRAALHAAILSPLKFLFQNKYEVFENIDSHGASFWVAVLSEACSKLSHGSFCLHMLCIKLKDHQSCAEVFFPGLQMPFESIVGLDGGWAWAAVDFLPFMQDCQHGACCVHLHFAYTHLC